MVNMLLLNKLLNIIVDKLMRVLLKKANVMKPDK